MNYSDMVSKTEYEKIEEFYLSVVESLKKSVDYGAFDWHVCGKFPARNLMSYNEETKLPSKNTIKNGGKCVVFERHYKDSEVEVVVKLEVFDMMYAIWNRFDPESCANGYVFLKNSVTYLVNGVKTKQSVDSSYSVTMEELESFSAYEYFTEDKFEEDFCGTGVLKDSRMSYPVRETEKRVLRLKSKSEKKEQDRNVLEVGGKDIEERFLDTKSTVEKEVYVSLKEGFKDVLSRCFCEYVQRIKNDYLDMTQFNYPKFLKSKTVYSAEEEIAYKYGSDAKYKELTLEQAKKLSDYYATMEIIGVINEVKEVGGSILGADKVRVGFDSRLNALFETEKGMVNVLTFYAAQDSLLVRPHLRTKITLLKG